MNPEFEILSNRLLSALGNGLYQGVVLCLIVGIGFRCFRGISAATRYAVGMVALLLLTALPVLHFFIGAPRTISVPPETTGPRPWEARKPALPADPIEFVPTPALVDTGIETRARSRFLAAASTAPEPLEEPLPFAGRATSPRAPHPDIGALGLSAEVPHRGTKAEDRALPTQPRSMSMISMPEVVPMEPGLELEDAIESVGFDLRTSAGLGAPLSARSEEISEVASALEPVPGAMGDWERAGRFRIAPHAWRPALPAWASLGLVFVWMVAAALGLLRILVQCLALRRVKRLAAKAPEGVARRFRELCHESRVKRPVVLGITEALDSPVAAGFLRPAILLPADMVDASPSPEMSQLLRHELAHLKRGDDWTNLVQLSVQALLQFHPGVWWLSRRLAVDREIACDDHVLAVTRTPREYALFLTDFAGRTMGRHWAVAPAAWSKRSQLTERIHMILDTHRNASPSVARAKVCTFGAMAALIAALGLYAGPRVALAASEDRSDRTSTATITGTAGSSSVSASASSIATPEPKSKDRAVVSVDGRTTTITSVSSDGTTTTLEAALPVAAPTPQPVPALPPAPASAPAPAALASPAPLPPLPPLYRSKRADNDDSLEARLERLEKMVESMVERSAGAWFKDGKPGVKFEHYGPNEKELQEIARVAREAGERAGRDAARAAKEIAKMAQVDQQKMHVQQEQLRAKAKQQEVKVRRDALEEQRRMLEKQIHEMERQIERLSDKLDQIDEQVDQFDDIDESDESKPRVEIKTRDHNLNLSVDVKPEVRLGPESGEKSKDKDKEKVKF